MCWADPRWTPATGQPGPARLILWESAAWTSPAETGSADAGNRSAYCLRGSFGWALEQGQFTLELDLPDGVEAAVELPDGSTRLAAGGSHHFAAWNQTVSSPLM
ncbi:alpha-L-rhamnosidase C-terminal domain-containing protein [Arthrobacter sp. OAP107]|uniref:alpha-L-rhamnosidase C-terminal domain-containing protein n=1 Tax=Arthrobacter sp. OAP107 TaxID=3156445 RepID=UPI0033921F24